MRAVTRKTAATARAFAQLAFAALVTLGAGATAPSFADSNPKDVKGSSDHPLFPNRMPGYSISVYQQQGFASYNFRTKPPTPIEGRYTKIHYYLLNANEHPGGLAIRRNYENAIKAVGGEVVYSDDNVSVMKATRDTVEVWAEVQASVKLTSARNYFLHIVERTAMAQVIKADAMAAAIAKDGFIALDVHFATGQSEILPDSKPLIAEMAAMLKSQPKLRVGIEGHTDNVGTPESNQALSEARAKAVVAALVAAGIAADRLEAVGHGQEKPIADNRTDAGRAQNRRVEMVKR